MRRTRHIPQPLTGWNNVSVHLFGPECLSRNSIVDNGLASAAWTANLLIFIPLLLVEPLLVSQFFWVNGATAQDNTDVGIYSFDGQTKFGSTGSTLNSGTSTLQVADVADFRLPSNVRLWMALGSDSSTHTYFLGNPVVAALDIVGVAQQASGWSSGLPATITPAIPTVAKMPLFGFSGRSTV